MEEVYKKIEEKHDLSFLKEFEGRDYIHIYAFGGLLRDIYLDRYWNDVDLRIVLNKPREEREEEVENCLRDYHLEGKVQLEDLNLTVYRFLPENSKLREHIDLSLVQKLDDNLPDFTINSLFFDLKERQLLDRFNGIDDLENKLIRTVKKPELQFSEEPHMIFRAIKFACQLDFEIESKTLNSMIDLKEKVQDTFDFIATQKEGIFVELFLGNIFKGLKASPVKYFEYLNTTGLTDELAIFAAKHLDTKTKDIYLEPIDKGSFEKNISYLLTNILNRVEVSNKEEAFNLIASKLALTTPKEYSDFVIDSNAIFYQE